MSARLELVILDCDGVLIDSEVISTYTLLEALQVHGLEIDIAHVRTTYLGRSMSTVAEDYHRLTGTLLPDSFESEFLGRLFTNYRRELLAMEGARKLIAEIPGEYCVATSSSIERATVSLEVTGLLPLFEGRIFSASMVPNGKPAPDLFLYAAKSYGANPARCLVIEDSEVGLRAAKNAGMMVWRFTGGSHFREAGKPLPDLPNVRVFDSMVKMSAALRAM